MGLKNFKKENKGRTACKAKQIYKMTTIFTQNAQLCKQFFLPQLEKNHVTQLATAKN